ncbi:MAG: hypothetical protein AAGA65_01435 [Actinomycetota bacterium]
MSKSEAGGRTDWKDRIDQSSWVDSTPWAGDERNDGEPGVEFLEAEPSAFRLNPEPTKEVSESLLSSSTSRFLALGAIGIVLIALAIMSRPGGDDPFDQLPTADQQQILERRNEGNDTAEPDAAADTGAASADAGDGTADGESTAGERIDGAVIGEVPSGTGTESAAEALPPIPRLRGDLPETLTGTIHITGRDGSLVSVDTTAGEINELPIYADVNGEPVAVSTMQQVGPELIMAGEGTLLQLEANGVEGTGANLVGLLPSTDGLTVVTNGGDGRQVFLVPPFDSGQTDEVFAVMVPSDLTLVGRWGQELLVEKAGKLWLLDLDGNVGPAITDGQFLSYDGQYLAMLRCDGSLECRLEVGTPDQPNRTVLAIPEQLAGRDAAAWGPSITITEDGQRLALVDDVGAFTAPLTIDLGTAAVTEGTDIVNGDSPLAWSPDGSVLAYAFGDDLVLWELGRDRRYRIDIDREIELMVWASDPPDAAAADGESDADESADESASDESADESDGEPDTDEADGDGG